MYVGICSEQWDGSKSRAMMNLIQCNTLVKPADHWLLSFVLPYRLASAVLAVYKNKLKLNVGWLNCSTCERRCENKRSKYVLRRNDILHYTWTDVRFSTPPPSTPSPHPLCHKRLLECVTSHESGNLSTDWTWQSKPSSPPPPRLLDIPSSSLFAELKFDHRSRRQLPPSFLHFPVSSRMQFFVTTHRPFS
jgi:hypothetical protein